MLNARKGQSNRQSISRSLDKFLGSCEPRVSRPTLAPWQVRLATRTMHRNIANAVSISDIAGMCRLSLIYFVRAFTNTVGIAPYAWFVQLRVCRSMTLLSETAQPLAQIALECGFSDQAHFTKAFSKATGSTPARWRRQDRLPKPTGQAFHQAVIPLPCRSGKLRVFVPD